MRDPGFHVVARSELTVAVEELRSSGARIFELPDGIASAASFFDAVCAVLPMNPPLMRASESWDALSDSVWGGLGDLDESRLVIVWADSEPLARSDPDAFGIAVDILASLPADLANPEFNAGISKEVTVLVRRD
jgi:Barstar (barnase inhibitor)